MKKIIKIIAKILTIFIYPKQKRQIRRYYLERKLQTKFFGGQVLKTAKSIGKDFWCGGFSCVNKHTILKDSVCFNGMFINGGGNVTIGSYFHSGMQCMIITQNHNYDNSEWIPYGTTYNYKDVIIDDFVWLGRRVTILPGTHIGEGAIIQAGSVVHGEIPPYAIAGGNPAKVFKYRDVEHFKKLKAEKKFNSGDAYCIHKFGLENFEKYAPNMKASATRERERERERERVAYHKLN